MVSFLFETKDVDLKCSILEVLVRCLESKVSFLSSVEKNTVLANAFFSQLFSRKMALLNKATIKTLSIQVAVLLSNKLGISFVLNAILGLLQDECEELRLLTLQTLEQLLTVYSADLLSDRELELIVDGILFIVQEQDLEEVSYATLSSYLSSHASTPTSKFVYDIHLNKKEF